MDPSLASTLMPLVCPYLSYEDTVRCLQLNRNFNRYIDDNWKDMTKKEIILEIHLVRSNEDVQENVSQFDVTFYTLEEEFNLRSSVRIDESIDETYVNVYQQQKPFLSSFLQKHASRDKNLCYDAVFYVDTKFDGLKLVLDCLVQRFAIGSLHIHSSNPSNMPETAALEVIGSSLKHFYPPKTRDVILYFQVSECEPYLNDLVRLLKVKKYDICSCGTTDPALDLRILETTNVDISACTYMWSQQLISEFLKEWLAGKRGIKQIKYELWQKDRRDPKREPIFKELCHSLGVIKIVNGTFGRKVDTRQFHLHRADGKILEVTHFLRRAHYDEVSKIFLIQLEYFEMREV